jgi:pyridoxamine 5'-phosphate oxidase family protein
MNYGGLMTFSEQEIMYMRSQHLGRLATVDADGQPDVVPVGYEYDGTYFYVGGSTPEKTRKFRNVRSGHTKVALVIDDLPSVDPWAARFLRIYGTADMVDEHTGYAGPGTYMRIKPDTSWSRNLDGQPWGAEGPPKTTRTTH